MKVKIVKLNSGIAFFPILNSGKPARVTPRSILAIKKAASWYKEEVLKTGKDIRALVEEGFLPLEPWGFAIPKNDGTFFMNDMGSVPTDGRLKSLIAYQSPLEVIKDGNDLRFERVIEV